MPLSMRTFRIAMLAAILAAWVIGCSAPRTPTGPSGPDRTDANAAPPGRLVLSASPIAQDRIRWITPLGNLNPPGHAIPTDHIYFYFADPDAREAPEARRSEFFAPGNGTVTTVLGGVGVESKVFVRQTSTFRYYIDHLILAAPLVRGSIVTAGQVLGTTGSAYGIDLGVVNESLNLNFIIPSHYIPDTLHADGPLKFFEEPLRSQLYARVERQGDDKDGRIDFDVPGRLSGNWFIGGTQAVLSFAYDTYDSSAVRISTARGNPQGVFSIAPGDPLPCDVSPASGLVRYTLRRAITGRQRFTFADPGIIGYMLVQMTNDTSIRMQMFLADTPPTEFTTGVGVYTR